MARRVVTLVLLIPVLTNGCRSAPTVPPTAAGPVAPAPAAPGGALPPEQADALAAFAAGPLPPWARYPDWLDNYPLLRTAAWGAEAVGLGVGAVVLFSAMVVGKAYVGNRCAAPGVDGGS